MKYPIVPKNGCPDWAAIVLVVGPNDQTVLVLDPAKQSPLWKLPGGKREGTEAPEETALRELREETGLSLLPASLHLHKEIDRSFHASPHSLFVFVGLADTFDDLKKRGNEGEYVAVFDLSRVQGMRDFFPHHWGHIRDFFEEALAN